MFNPRHRVPTSPDFCTAPYIHQTTFLRSLQSPDGAGERSKGASRKLREHSEEWRPYRTGNIQTKAELMILNRETYQS